MNIDENQNTARLLETNRSNVSNLSKKSSSVLSRYHEQNKKKGSIQKSVIKDYMYSLTKNVA